MNIILKKLTLRNFKGIKELSIDFSKTTNVYGNNGTGKTTIFDSFTWLLFDKDSQDRAKFDVQPLDAQGNVIHMVDTEVEGVLNVDGKDITLRKVLKEKWTRKRGEQEAELKGTETSYYINEVPAKQSEYKQYIGNIIDENIFKLITNPLYFSINLKWQDRRKVLMDIIGDIGDEQIINYKPDLKPLEALLVDKDIDTLKKSISARRKKLNDDLKGIPPRVDELQRSIREDLDFDTLDFQRRGIIAGIKNIEEKLLDSSKINEDVLNDKKKLYELQAKLLQIEQAAKDEAQKPYLKLYKDLQDISIELNRAKSKLTLAKDNENTLRTEIERLTKINEELRERWAKENTKTLEFNEDAFICPTCKRPFDDEDIEVKKQEMTQNFNVQKAEKLKSITEQGKANNEKIAKLKQQIADMNTETLEANVKALEEKAQSLKSQINNFNPTLNLENNVEYKSTKLAIEALQAKLQQPSQINFEIQQLKQKRQELEKELEEVNSKLAYKETNERAKARIEELMEDEKKLAQQIAELEKQEYLADEFIKTKVELLESSINSKFKYVTFKLFETQVNGGINECCEALINGVPFSSANTAGQINAGLDIINALSEYYQVSAPIFIDNRESINNLIHTNSQVINLIVSKDKTLRIENEEE